MKRCRSVILAGSRLLAGPLGGMFEALGTTRHPAGLLAVGMPLACLPLLVFVVDSSLAVITGTLWGTMGMLRPLALPAALGAAHAAGMPPASTTCPPDPHAGGQQVLRQCNRMILTSYPIGFAGGAVS